MKPRPALATFATLALIAALGLLWQGCGDDESGDGTTTSAIETAGETTATVSEETTESVETTTTGTDEGPGYGSAGDLEPEPCPGAESPPNITNVLSYGTDCQAVEDAMAEIGGITKTFAIGDFQCERSTGSKYGGTWTCFGEANYFSFDFAD